MINKEIKSLTGIRGIAALYVAIHHSLIGNEKQLGNLSHTFISKGYLAVDLFFSLSGFVMMLSSSKYFINKVDKKSYISFMQKRFARVYPVYFFVITTIFIYQSFHPLKTYLVSLPLLSAVFNQGNILNVVWSLSAEWVIYMLFPFVCFFTYSKILNGYRIMLLPLVAIVVLTLFRFDLSILKLQSNAFHGIQPLMRCLGNYLLGMYAYLVIIKNQSSLKTINILSILLSVTIITLLLLNGTNNIVVLLFPVLVALLYKDEGVVSWFLSTKVIYFLGLISYSLYLTHQFFLRWKKPVSDYIGYYISDEIWRLLTFNGVFIILIVIIATILYRYIELPAQKFLKKRLAV